MALHSRWTDNDLEFYDGVQTIFKIPHAGNPFVFGEISKFGTSTSPMELTAGSPILSIYTTCDTTSTEAIPSYFEATMTGIGGVGFATKTVLATNVALGSYATTIYGVLDLKTAGGVSGLGSAVCAELVMPGGAAGIGTFGALELEVTCPASWTSSQQVSLIFANASGITAGKFNDEGYLINFYNGIVSATTHLLYTHTITTPGAAAGSLRIIIGGTPYYLYFWGNEGTT